MIKYWVKESCLYNEGASADVSTTPGFVSVVKSDDIPITVQNSVTVDELHKAIERKNARIVFAEQATNELLMRNIKLELDLNTAKRGLIQVTQQCQSKNCEVLELKQEIETLRKMLAHSDNERKDARSVIESMKRVIVRLYMETL